MFIFSSPVLLEEAPSVFVGVVGLESDWDIPVEGGANFENLLVILIKGSSVEVKVFESLPDFFPLAKLGGVREFFLFLFLETGVNSSSGRSVTVADPSTIRSCNVCTIVTILLAR